MVRGVEVNGSIAMTHAIIVSATTTVRFVKAHHDVKRRTVHLRSSQTSSKFELAQLSLGSILEGRFVVLRKL